MQFIFSNLSRNKATSAKVWIRIIFALQISLTATCSKPQWTL